MSRFLRSSYKFISKVPFPLCCTWKAQYAKNIKTLVFHIHKCTFSLKRKGVCVSRKDRDLNFVNFVEKNWEKKFVILYFLFFHLFPVKNIYFLPKINILWIIRFSNVIKMKKLAKITIWVFRTFLMWSHIGYIQRCLPPKQ